MEARGTLTGNRGILHDDDRRIIRSYQTRRWIACRLNYRGVRREVMAPRRWTELFFLDEATSLAAGHRPCFFCRHDEAVRFAELWVAARGSGRLTRGSGRARAAEMDRELHPSRLWADHPAVDPATLPPGVMIEVGDSPAVVVTGGLRFWSFAGYGPLEQLAGDALLLTPPPTVAVITAGYDVGLHPSAGR